MNPLEFKPRTIDDFIGPARKVATLLDKMLTARKPTGIPIRVLLKGDPGVGKSALAHWLIGQLTSNPLSVKRFNGTEVNMDRLDELIQDLSYHALDGYRCVHIDEADAIPPTAHKRFLSYMDRLKETPFSAIVITSNEGLDNFEERFQTRFQAFDVEGPSYEELVGFLGRFSNDTGMIQAVARCACGLRPGSGKSVQLTAARANVRQALDDLDTALLAAA